jgi:ribonuclease BN (tRNA processing enzyme)
MPEMKIWIPNIVATISFACVSLGAAASGCDGIAVQVLGSGGPTPNGARASSGYVVWIDGHSRVLVDAGGGTFLRFGESGATLEDLNLIALTHFHADHVADIPALVKAGFFSDRKAPLPISGPSKGGEFPGLKQFLTREFSAHDGAFAYLSGALDGSGGQFRLDPIEVTLPRDTVQAILDTRELKVTAAPVKHGPVPALGYLVKAQDKTIAFSGDQNGDNPIFWKMIDHADVLVVHMAIPEKADAVASKLHATPSSIGRHASDAHVGQVVLSHLMPRSLANLDENVAIVRDGYHGKVTVASDLQCFSP